jgi:hypothetical protein
MTVGKKESRITWQLNDGKWTCKMVVQAEVILTVGGELTRDIAGQTEKALLILGDAIDEQNTEFLKIVDGVYQEKMNALGVTKQDGE